MHFCELRIVQRVPEDASLFTFLIGIVVGGPSNWRLTFPNTKREKPRRTYPELGTHCPSVLLLKLHHAPGYFCMYANVLKSSGS